MMTVGGSFPPYTPPEPPPLTPAERRVAQLVAEKWTTKRIAGALAISTRRVRALITAIAFKTQVQPGEDDRVHVAVWWREHGAT
jgi:DNA-binding CsgD family transcriptional regulator